MLRWTLSPTLAEFRSAQVAVGAVCIGCLLLFASESSFGADNSDNVAEPLVRIVYLVPADRAERADYADRLEAAVKHVQIWTRNEMGDRTTFTLRKRPVEVFHTSHDASWYSANPAGEFSLWFWSNVLAEAFALTGGGFFDPHNTWVFYIDSDPACGQLVGATSGVAVLPANDLRGLASETNIPACPWEPPDTAGVCRWVGGLGHELGHAFGLPHPPACEDSDPDTVCPTDALLWLGYITYPQTFLLAEDKQTLEQSAFFSDLGLRKSLPDCSGPPGRR
jgi:hypothetical protein